MKTCRGVELPDEIVRKYMVYLIGQFYKILPIKESGEPTLAKYMESLQREMIGNSRLIAALDHDELYLSLLAILQYLIDHEMCETSVVKSEVFKAINICKKLQKKYGEEVFT